MTTPNTNKNNNAHTEVSVCLSSVSLTV